MDLFPTLSLHPSYRLIRTSSLHRYTIVIILSSVVIITYFIKFGNRLFMHLYKKLSICSPCTLSCSIMIFLTQAHIINKKDCVLEGINYNAIGLDKSNLFYYLNSLLCCGSKGPQYFFYDPMVKYWLLK